ncbi:MAG: menaquinone biosynthesis protein [Spirochaetia bacterium]|nr:menaquinone biosynthesis protein [Spirochaetia bacterium]
MRFGLISYLNAAPLQYGLRNAPELCIAEPCQFEDDIPARLYEGLLSRRFDTALISSVECLRNREFAFCSTVGVCGSGRVRSILYIRRKRAVTSADLIHAAPDRLLVDEGSRTSVALLHLLLKRSTGKHIESSPARARDIPERLGDREGGLLIGDAALQFWNRPDIDEFVWKDLAEWWFDLEALPFVFALWAYRKSETIPDSVFEKSLEIGLNNLDTIIRESGRQDAKSYLTEIIHYKLSSKDREALNVFEERLKEEDLF